MWLRWIFSIFGDHSEMPPNRELIVAGAVKFENSFVLVRERYKKCEQKGGQTDRQIDKQMDGRTDRQADRGRAGEQTDK